MMERSGGEISLRTAKGNPIPVLLSLNSLAEEETTGIYMVVMDLRERKRQEEILASERFTRSILAQANDAIIVCDERGQVIRANEMARKLCGRDPLMGSFDVIFPLSAGESVPLPLASVLKREGVRGVEVDLSPRRRGGLLVASQFGTPR